MVRNSKLITAITTEPVSLIEAKRHLRIDSGTLEASLSQEQMIAPADHIVGATTSSGFSILGYNPLITINSGTNGTSGTVDVKIQESDDDVTYQDYYSFTQITEANDNAVYSEEYAGAMQYVRVVATVGTETCNYSVLLTKESPVVENDEEVEAMITSAREYCETVTGRALATQTWEMYLDDFPTADYVDLMYAPLQSVTSVIYKDSDGDETTLTEDTDYLVDDDSDIGKIVLPYSESWPSFTPYPYNAVTVKYVAGYYSSNTIPEAIKRAMLLLISHWYVNREAVITGTTSKKIELAVDSLLFSYRIRWYKT